MNQLWGDGSPIHSLVPGQVVYVIDDDVAIRRSLHYVLATAGYTTWPFGCAFDFLDSLAKLQPAPILLDIRMPEIDGNELIARLADQGTDWPIIVMTAYAQIPVAVEAMKLGATDVLEKPLDFEMLDTALRAAVEQMASIKNASEIRSRARQLFEVLSRREREVMAILMEGLPNRIVAGHLSLSVRTIEMHRANALQKLKVKSIGEAVRLAAQAELNLTTLSDVL